MSVSFGKDNEPWSSYEKSQKDRREKIYNYKMAKREKM